MERIKYDKDMMKLMSLFEGLTRAHLKDSFVDSQGLLVFVVEDNQIGTAVGKGGSKVRELERRLNRKIKIVEFNSNPLQFVKNVIYPLKVGDIQMDDTTIVITSPDVKTRGYLIGRNASALRNTESIVKRYFDINEIKVV